MNLSLTFTYLSFFNPLSLHFDLPQSPSFTLLTFTLNPSGDYPLLTLLPRPQRELPSRTLGPAETSYVAESVSTKDKYEFWVSASTQKGEGKATGKIEVHPSSKGKGKCALLEGGKGKG